MLTCCEGLAGPWGAMEQCHEARAFSGDQIIHGSCLVDIRRDHGLHNIFVLGIKH